MAVRIFAVSVLLSLAATLFASDTERLNDFFEPLQLINEGSDDGPAMAYALTQTFLSPEQWQSEVASFKVKYSDWEQQTDGDVGRYLNDRLIIVALSAANGKVEKVQKSIVWLAMYKEFSQPPPKIVNKFLREHRGSVTRLFDRFTWEKASQYIKNKEWRRDIAERNAQTTAIADK